MEINEISNQAYIEELLKEIGEGKDSFTTFDKLIDLMDGRNKPVFYYNNLPRQTRKILNVILTKAKNNSFLKMFLGDVNCEFYGIDFLKSLEEFAAKRCVVDVVLADRPSDKMSNRWLSLENNKQVHIFCKNKYDDTVSHLCFTDNAYRIEAPHPQLAENERITDITPKRPARFGFYIPEDIEALKKIWSTTVLPDTSPLNTYRNS